MPPTPTQFAYRTAKDLGVVDAAPIYAPLSGFTKPEGNLRCCTYSPCGRYFAWASPDRVTILNPSNGAVVTTLQAENVFELGFSPKGTFVITWQRPSKDDNGDAVKNLKVWRVVESAPAEADGSEHAVVGRFVQKSQTGWNLQYTQDEKFCARVVTNEVQFYESGDLGKVWNKLRVEGVADFAISSGESPSIAVFVPERKGLPAAVKVYAIPSFGSPVSQKNFFKGDKVQMKWNNHGTSLIVLAQTEVDKTGKSYYGETTLYLMSARGGFDSRIDLDKEGPIHDVTWSPNSREFGVVYGYMPAKTVIFNTRAVATHTFALGPRNTILFSPHGKYVLVAGFGNLAGQMDIYDLEKDYKKICTIEASNASVCEFSPDGRHILTATTSPRLRVDNGIRIWHVGGTLQYNEDHNELYHVCWRPQSPDMHPLGMDPLRVIPAPHSSATSYLSTKKTPSKPAGAYRPPGARGTSTPLSFKREDEGGAAFIRDGGNAGSFGPTGSLAALERNGFPGRPGGRRVVPGAEPVSDSAAPGGGVALPPGAEAAGADEKLSKAAAKNKKKREAKKAKELAEKAANLTVSDAVEGGNGSGKAKSASRSPSGRQGGRSRSATNRGNANGNLNGTNGNARGRSRSSNRQQQRNGATPPSMPTAAAPSTPQRPTIKTTTSNTPAPPDLTVTSPLTPAGPQEKKIRGLLKKIRAIDELKMRLAGGEKLEDTQMKKIRTEDGVRKELEGLGWMG